MRRRPRTRYSGPSSVTPSGTPSTGSRRNCEQVLRATVLDGLTVRETAALLGLPEGTVKTRARRAPDRSAVGHSAGTGASPEGHAGGGALMNSHAASPTGEGGHIPTELLGRYTSGTRVRAVRRLVGGRSPPGELRAVPRPAPRRRGPLQPCHRGVAGPGTRRPRGGGRPQPADAGTTASVEPPATRDVVGRAGHAAAPRHDSPGGSSGTRTRPRRRRGFGTPALIGPVGGAGRSARGRGGRLVARRGSRTRARGVQPTGRPRPGAQTFPRRPRGRRPAPCGRGRTGGHVTCALAPAVPGVHGWRLGAGRARGAASGCDRSRRLLWIAGVVTPSLVVARPPGLLATGSLPAWVAALVLVVTVLVVRRRTYTCLPSSR